MIARTFRLALAFAATTLMLGAAHAQEVRSNRTVITTDDGREFVREETVRGRAGDRSGTVRWTGPDGRTATREYRRTFDRENGYRRQSTTTGPRGRTGSVDARVRCADGACARTVERQRPTRRARRVRGPSQRDRSARPHPLPALAPHPRLTADPCASAASATDGRRKRGGEAEASSPLRLKGTELQAQMSASPKAEGTALKSANGSSSSPQSACAFASARAAADK